MKLNDALIVLVALALVFSGCGRDRDNGPLKVGGSDAGHDAADADNRPELPEPKRDLSGPEVRDFSVTPERLTEGEAATINVTLTDPQGFDDIGGGRLLDMDDRVYTSFAGSGGTFHAQLTWEQINAAELINFDDREYRVFIAEFFDSDDHRTTEPFMLELHCGGASACDGNCGSQRCTEECTYGGIRCEPGGCVASTELNDDENCGACGNVCDEGLECDRGQCRCESHLTQCGGDCADTNWNGDHCGSCDNSCSGESACFEGECTESVGSFFPCSDDAHCPRGSCHPDVGCLIGNCSDSSQCPGETECVEDHGFPVDASLCFYPCGDRDECPSYLICHDFPSVSQDYCIW